MIPYAEIRTLSLDVGNTLISIDFPLISSELQSHGLNVSPEALRRAEAAGRPAFSKRMGQTSGQVDYSFQSYIQEVLSRVDFPQSPGKEGIRSLAADLADTLQADGQANRIWRWVLPGVPEALESFRSLGIQLVALSNSDGTAELSLKEAGLRDYFSTVIDSAIVGYEKPDPADIRVCSLEVESPKGKHPPRRRSVPHRCQRGPQCRPPRSATGSFWGLAVGELRVASRSLSASSGAERVSRCVTLWPTTK